MKSKNLYHILDVDPSATNEEIKKAYRIHASKLHPDKHNGDKFFEEKFKELNHAYETLGDPHKRKLYDESIGDDQPSNLRSEPKTSYGEYTESKSKWADEQTYQKADVKSVPIDPIKSQRIKNTLIGLCTFLTLWLLSTLGETGWHEIPMIILLLWTIRQIFVVLTSFLKD